MSGCQEKIGHCLAEIVCLGSGIFVDTFSWMATIMTVLDQTGIRRFQHSDLSSLQRLISETLDVSYKSLYPPRAVAFFRTFHAEQKILERSQAGSVLVTEKDGKIIATGSLVEGEILAVFVLPAYQHGGHGKALMRVLEEEARASGLGQVVLSVSLPSRRFYQSLGYTIIQACSKNVGDGQRLDFWKASKTLTPPDP